MPPPFLCPPPADEVLTKQQPAHEVGVRHDLDGVDQAEQRVQAGDQLLLQRGGRVAAAPAAQRRMQCAQQHHHCTGCGGRPGVDGREQVADQYAEAVTLAQEGGQPAERHDGGGGRRCTRGRGPAQQICSEASWLGLTKEISQERSPDQCNNILLPDAVLMKGGAGRRSR